MAHPLQASSSDPESSLSCSLIWCHVVHSKATSPKADPTRGLEPPWGDWFLCWGHGGLAGRFSLQPRRSPCISNELVVN